MVFDVVFVDFSGLLCYCCSRLFCCATCQMVVLHSAVDLWVEGLSVNL